MVLLAIPHCSWALPSFNEVRAAHRPSDAWLLARDGRPLAVRRIDTTVRRLPWVPLKEVAPSLRRAVLLSEDKRFQEHGGVDWSAMVAGAWSTLGNERTRGASTLTMQLVGLLDADTRRRGRRSLLEKLSQTAAALRLERTWKKEQILEAYLNLAPFRGELEGVAAMSRGLFNKWPEGLDEQESAIAAALLRAPNAKAEVVAKRACLLLKEMDRAQFCKDVDGLAAVTLGSVLRRADDTPPLAPHLARQLLKEPGQRLKSTLDLNLQTVAAESLRRHLALLKRHNVEDGAVLVADNASGEILAWVGSSGDLSDAAEVDGVTALRQAGSTLKPFLYGMAFERRDLTPASLIEDAPLSLDTGNGLYAPQNYNPDYRGWVSARIALAGSLNVPAVKTLVRIGADDFAQRLRRFGFNSLIERGDWYGYSLALGSADVSLLDMANAYRALANGGVWSPLRATPESAADATASRQSAGATSATRITGTAGKPGESGEPGESGATSQTPIQAGKPRRALSAAASFLVGDILSDRAARSGTFGLESWLATPYWSAAKTGTSKDMRDNWCAGFSHHYTVAVWVGNASGTPMHEVSGISGAAPVWREVMDWLHRGKARSMPPAAPPGLVARTIRFEDGASTAREPPRREWFLAGTERSVIQSARAAGLARIVYPADGSIIALDPDIPPMRQRILLQVSSSAGASQRLWTWRLDGKPLGRIDRATHWLPQPGRHRLILADAKGQEMDGVSFEVRGLKGKR